MFFEPQLWEKKEPVSLYRSACVTGTGYAAEVLQKTVADWGKADGTVNQIRLISGLPEHFSISENEEAYALVITETEALLYGKSHRALIYAAVTLQQMCNHRELFTGRLEDAPDCSFRSYRVYMPGRKSFQEFFDMVDLLVYYKYNYISLEVGGAMEYKRHPEINEAWEKFAADTHRYSGRAHEIQNGYGWAKNSIHTDNGEGDVLTQDEVRMLVSYCRERGLNVFPEVPTLSHSDYICLAHPELRERAEDPYPDTYCPNHPDVYNIVFDILEEVIEVFKPDMINIGHDEFYTMCLCPRCKGKNGYDVYAQDIIKIHDWLAERGIRTAMWGEKLLPVVTQNGSVFGGSGNCELHPTDHPRHVPPTFYCQCLLPKDILMIHWYYSFGMQHDFVYHTHGYEMVFGNMSAEKIPYWRDRRKYGAKGGMCSNWGSNHPEYLQRNNQYSHLIFGAFAMWSAAYDSNQQNEVLAKTYKEAFHFHYGNLDEHPYIVVTHTTDKKHKYKVFYDGVFIEDSVYHMGNYKLTYTDGTEVLFDVKYGTNISNCEIPCMEDLSSENFDPNQELDCSALGEVAYSTIPVSKNGKTWYTTVFTNPHPEKTVRSFVYVPDTDGIVEVLKVKI